MVKLLNIFTKSTYILIFVWIIVCLFSREDDEIHPDFVLHWILVWTSICLAMSYSTRRMTSTHIGTVHFQYRPISFISLLGFYAVIFIGVVWVKPLLQ